MPSMEQPEPASPGFAILLGPKQITAVLVVAVSVAGILCSLSYIAGRSGSRAPAAPAAKTVLVIPAAPRPAPVAVVKAPEIKTWKNAPPVDGATYFQLMSVEPGVAEVFAEGLYAEGYDAIAAPGASAGVQRVLVGPLKEGSADSVRTRLEARGLHPFVKRYPEEPPKTQQPKSGN